MKLSAPHNKHGEAEKQQSNFIQRSVNITDTEKEELPFISAKRISIQPKLTIGAPNDPYEQEADAMAEHVMRMPLNSKGVPLNSSMNNNLPLQRLCSECEEEMQVQRSIDINDESDASEHIANRLNSRRGQGLPLPANLRTQMGQSFGIDFSNVRIHTDSEAAQMSQDINAQAFTHGSDIYFNKGKYDSDSPDGQKLMAHELTHVIQQGAVKTKSNHIQKEADEPPEAVGCSMSREARADILQRSATARRLLDAMQSSILRSRSISETGRTIELTPEIIQRADRAISNTFGLYISGQSQLSSLIHSHILNIHQPGSYGSNIVSDRAAAIMHISQAAFEHVSDDLSSACIYSNTDELLISEISERLLSLLDDDITLVQEYVEANFPGRTSFVDGSRRFIDLLYRATYNGHRLIHEAMHYYVHQNYRAFAESSSRRDNWKDILMEGGAEFLTRHVIHTQLEGDTNFHIRQSTYGNELASFLRLRMSFDTFLQAYFNGRVYLVSERLPEEGTTTIQRKQLHDIPENGFHNDNSRSIAHKTKIDNSVRTQLINRDLIQKDTDQFTSTGASPLHTGRRIPLQEINPEAVIQGQLNDCYLMAALMSLVGTEHGRRLISESVIQENPFRYRVRLFVFRQSMVPIWLQINYTPREGRPVAPWVRVIEQAYAELYPADPFEREGPAGEFAGMGGEAGGTEIEGAARAFNHLTGEIATMISISERSSADELWERISSALDSGRHVVAGTPRGLIHDFSAAGIYEGHNYSVIEAIEINGQRMVRLRNPWGHRFSRRRGDFTEAQQRGLTDDPVFSISFDSFLERFIQISISDFPATRAQAVHSCPAPPSIQAKRQNHYDAVVESLNINFRKTNELELQRQVNLRQRVRRDFAAFSIIPTIAGEGSRVNYYINFNINLVLETNLMEGLNSNHVQSLITDLLNSHGGGQMTINSINVFVNWNTRWIPERRSLGEWSDRSYVDRGLAVGVSIVPGNYLSSHEGMWVYENGIHRILISGDDAFEALNTTGRDRTSRQRRRDLYNSFGNEFTHELGHSLGLSDLGRADTVMHRFNSTNFRNFNGDQIRQIIINLTDDPDSLPDWIRSG